MDEQAVERVRAVWGQRARGFCRRWLPYWLAAAGLFWATTLVGTAVGAERASLLVPVRSRGTPAPDLDAAALFAHNFRVGLFMMGGVLLFGLPTVLLLAYNGFLFGAAMADAAGRLGVARAFLLVAPHGVLELPAIWLAGGVGLRWIHLGWSLISGTDYATGVPRAVADSVGAGVLVAVALAVAAAVEAVVTVPLARLLT